MKLGIRFMLCALTAAPLAGRAIASGSLTNSLDDAAGDAGIRRSDPGADGPINPLSAAPDVLSLTIGAWSTPTPTTNPYGGAWTSPTNADLVRINLVVDGLVNPAGPLGIGAQGFNPYQFGPRPLYGFVEFDIDRSRNTGGELGPGAQQRFLANAARFGGLPYGSIAERVPTSAAQIDTNFNTDPQFERSGADFALTFCGCFNISVVNNNGDTNSTFDAGDTWVVRGRFFQRAGGYEEASACFGGSFPGLYDPLVNLRFSHSIVTNRTTISLVYPLRMHGAALLAGQPDQPLDLDVSNHTSVEEAIDDVIAGSTEPLSPPARELTHRWAGQSVYSYLDPTDWDFTFIVGTTYAQVEPALYAWTDVGFELRAGDYDADGSNGTPDFSLFDANLAARDGSPTDADGIVNGSVTIPNFGVNFDLFDLNNDGRINAADRAGIPFTLSGDADNDCTVGLSDLAVLITNWNTSGPAGDLDGDDLVGLSDVAIIIQHWMTSCP